MCSSTASIGGCSGAMLAPSRNGYKTHHTLSMLYTSHGSCRPWTTKRFCLSVSQASRGETRRNLKLEERPSTHCEAKREIAAYDWEGKSRRFVCIVDCQPMQAVICGHSPLLNDDLQHAFRRITNNLANIFAEEWRPPRTWHDPVQWRPRGENMVADFWQTIPWTYVNHGRKHLSGHLMGRQFLIAASWRTPTEAPEEDPFLHQPGFWELER